MGDLELEIETVTIVRANDYTTVLLAVTKCHRMFFQCDPFESKSPWVQINPITTKDIAFIKTNEV